MKKLLLIAAFVLSTILLSCEKERIYCYDCVTSQTIFVTKEQYVNCGSMGVFTVYFPFSKSIVECSNTKIPEYNVTISIMVDKPCERTQTIIKKCILKP